MTKTPGSDAERAMFETWCEANKRSTSLDQSGDFYWYAETDAAWQAWQAARSLSVQGVDAERLDAERYRWLREHSDSMSLNPPLTVAKVTGWGLEGWSGDDLNSAIDAAITQQKEGL